MMAPFLVIKRKETKEKDEVYRGEVEPLHESDSSSFQAWENKKNEEFYRGGKLLWLRNQS